MVPTVTVKERKYGIGLVELQLPTGYGGPVLFLTRNVSRGESREFAAQTPFSRFTFVINQRVINQGCVFSILTISFVS